MPEGLRRWSGPGSLLLLGLVAGCGGREAGLPADRSAETAGRPNIVVVVVDDLRWDEFGIIFATPKRMACLPSSSLPCSQRPSGLTLHGQKARFHDHRGIL